MFDASVLVEEKKTTWLEMIEELDVVKSRQKPVSMRSFVRREGGIDSVEYSRFMEESLQRGLLFVGIVECASIPDVTCFALHTEELWRVSALLIASKSSGRYRWSDSSEYCRSSLLGYSDVTIEQWLQDERHLNVVWGNQTMYLVVDRGIRDELSALGMRAFPARVALVDVVAFMLYPDAVIRRDVERVLPEAAILLRVAISEHGASKLFRHVQHSEQGPILQRDLSQYTGSELNQDIRSEIQTWQNGKWV